ncbi:hypothetical protein CLOBOL_05138 [Enterocloster bolteae ATCC BAA-613]|uniref:Uncharacterized protein n=1 Tax=Enterocloster bolteae (strain ATCC BAA-613 / DSM 15670 / CCUG 46953 / JCM 12243 / WAL 16351) TaxID=411902 RepID=A8RYI8_ENTBW|nr:hypothetical protein CLOBOL_05138 [Enterocloster bolteae ATCC BAA-613]
MDGAPFMGKPVKNKKTRPAPNCAQAMPYPTYVVNCIEISMLRGSAAEFVIHGIRLLLM